MADIVRIVDSISATPTTLLDLNDETSWWTRSLKAPPPRLRRSVAQNAMTDGDHTGAATYGSRVLELVLESRESTQDAAATQMQTLFRLLDNADGKFLQYQPQGASAPVFFVLERSDLSDLSDIMAQAAMRAFTVELKCEPFALGLKESLGPYTVANDPAAATNPGCVDLPTILGDVPADVVYWDEASVTAPQRLVAVRWSATPSAVTAFLHAESATSLYTDTTNPGGGPDAAMSGTGTNNYVRTSFATNATMVRRVGWNPVVQPGGRYRVLAAVRRSGSGSEIKMRAKVLGVTGTDVTIPTTSGSRIVADLGVISWPDASPSGYSQLPGTSTTTAGGLEVHASRTSGTDTLDIDGVHLIPAGGQYDATGGTLALTSYAQFSTSMTVLDGITERAFCASASADPTTTSVEQYVNKVAGSFPRIAPGIANRLYVLAWTAASSLPVTTTTTVNISYWPRYLYVRPSAS